MESAVRGIAPALDAELEAEEEPPTRLAIDTMGLKPSAV
jgi:hypothetical protein